MTIPSCPNKSNQNFDQEKLNSLDFIYIVPGILLADKRINKLRHKHRLIMLVAELFSLAKASGYAFISNKKLAFQHGVGISTIERDMRDLEKWGYITRDTKYIQEKNRRHVYVADLFSNNFCGPSPARGSDPHQRGLEERRANKKSTTLTTVSDPLQDESCQVKPKKEKKQTYGELSNVKLTSKEFSRLCEKFGEKRASRWVDKLDAYIGSKGKKYKSHYATIIQWHYSDKERDEKQNTPITPKKDPNKTGHGIRDKEKWLKKLNAKTE